MRVEEVEFGSSGYEATLALRKRVLRDPLGLEWTDEEKAWVVSHLLRFAQWDDIWTYVSRDEVRELFPKIEMPEKLQAAWARMLKVDAPVTVAAPL